MELGVTQALGPILGSAEPALSDPVDCCIYPVDPVRQTHRWSLYRRTRLAQIKSLLKIVIMIISLPVFLSLIFAHICSFLGADIKTLMYMHVHMAIYIMSQQRFPYWATPGSRHPCVGQHTRESCGPAYINPFVNLRVHQNVFIGTSMAPQKTLISTNKF